MKASRELCYYCFDAVVSHLEKQKCAPPEFQDTSCPLCISWAKRVKVVDAQGKERNVFEARGSLITMTPVQLHSDQFLRTIRASAFEDPRQNPITAEDIPYLRCSASVILPETYKTIQKLDDWEVGKHGIRILFKVGATQYSKVYPPETIIKRGWGEKEAIEKGIRGAGYTGDLTPQFMASVEIIRFETSSCIVSAKDYFKHVETKDKKIIVKGDVGTCAVCFEGFDEAAHLPRLLHCGHSFCTECLTQLSRSSPHSLTCPKCRSVTSLSGGVNVLPRNFDLVDLLATTTNRQQHPNDTRAWDNCAKDPADKFCERCGGHLCLACDDRLHSTPLFKGHVRMASAEVPATGVLPTCAAHNGKPLEFWCGLDSVSVCTSCLLVGAHQGHKAVSIEEAAEAAKTEARARLAALEADIGTVEKALAEVAANEAHEHSSAADARAAAARQFAQIREVLDQRERTIEGQLQLWEGERAQAARDKRTQLLDVKRRLETVGRDMQATVMGARWHAIVAQGEAATIRVAAEEARALVTPLLLKVSQPDSYAIRNFVHSDSDSEDWGDSDSEDWGDEFNVWHSRNYIALSKNFRSLDELLPGVASIGDDTVL